MSARKVKPTSQQKKAAREVVRKGKTPAEALRCAGFSPAQARKGAGEFVKRAGLRKALKDEYNGYLKKCADLPELKDQAAIITHRLLQNIINGKDGGAQSAKLLGSHRDLRLWEPDTSVSIHIDRTLLDVLDTNDIVSTQKG
jgi:hypothetical protein